MPNSCIASPDRTKGRPLCALRCCDLPRNNMSRCFDATGDGLADNFVEEGEGNRGYHESSQNNMPLTNRSKVKMIAPDSTKARASLRRIARRVMMERGMLPDFSSEAMAELDRIGKAPAAAEGQGGT